MRVPPVEPRVPEVVVVMPEEVVMVMQEVVMVVVEKPLRHGRTPDARRDTRDHGRLIVHKGRAPR
ncbi:hypothetical protein [Mycobacterium shimoidei]|uniref:hypothetical protein n=1 Tax=Mycobacterium shimoidei TaxID=29313 RepID=UPI00111BD7D3|nr:hypothetical protein [Mycobacterium shimoidei]MCV7261325.1 hypothetical protein [Mycobacterium shimoidei]